MLPKTNKSQQSLTGENSLQMLLRHLQAYALSYFLMAILTSAIFLPGAYFPALGKTSSEKTHSAVSAKSPKTIKAAIKEKLELGEFQLFNGNPQGAVKFFCEAEAANPDLIEPHLRLIDLYKGTGDSAAAIKECREVLRLKPNELGVNSLLGELFCRQGNFDEAIVSFTKESELTNQSLPAESNLAFALLAGGQLDAASRHFKVLINRQPDKAEFHLGLATAEAKMDHPDCALEETNLALSLKPVFPEALILLGDLRCNSGLKDKAIEAYQSAIRADETFAQSYLSLGNLYIKEGEFQAAKEIFLQAIKRAEPNREILYGLAFALEKLGDLVEAASIFRLAVQFEPDPVNVDMINSHLNNIKHNQSHNQTTP